MRSLKNTTAAGGGEMGEGVGTACCVISDSFVLLVISDGERKSKETFIKKFIKLIYKVSINLPRKLLLKEHLFLSGYYGVHTKLSVRSPAEERCCLSPRCFPSGTSVSSGRCCCPEGLPGSWSAPNWRSRVEIYFSLHLSRGNRFQ